MKIHVLKHVPFEDIGSMAGWLEAKGADIGYTRFYDDPALPKVNGHDLIIAMGGPMSAMDESALPWLGPEKQFIRAAVEQGIPVLGICLGAQLIAGALGAAVYRNQVKEIGWWQIEGTPDASDSFRFPAKFIAFHWHGETFDLPDGAVRLATNAACANQAFQIGQHVIGLQFHLETTPDALGAIIDNCGGELAPGPYVQTQSEMREVSTAAYAEINGLMGKILSYLCHAS